MKIFRAYKTELDPNNKQRTLFCRYAGAARFTYNWALADRQKRFEAGQPTNLYEQKKRFNALKHVQYPWLGDIAYIVTGESFRNLDSAYQNFFRRVRKGEKPGFPKFKSKKNGLGTFTFRASIHVKSRCIKLPRLGWIRTKEYNYLPQDDIKILSATVSEHAHKWFVSVQAEQEIAEPKESKTQSLGVDVGIKSLAVCSDGRVFNNPRSLKMAQQKLKRLQRELSRRKIGGKNRKKTKTKLARCHMQVVNIRKHALHQISHDVTAKNKPSTIVIENLNVSGMVKNHQLAKTISDSSFAELHRQIEYKAQWNGIQVIKADRFFPSSKRCSACGYKKDDLTLADRTFVCPQCGVIIDRDLNAALNLASLAV